MEPTKLNASDHLANERTFLAWIRTSIGIMAFGFVVVKFSLFLKQISLILGKQNALPAKGYSGYVGIVLVAVGTITAILAFLQFKRTEKQLNGAGYKPSSTLFTVLTAFLFVVSVFLIVYLINSI